MEIRKAVEVVEWPLALGVSGKVVLKGEKMMFFLVRMEPGAVVPKHSHPNEQMGLCLKGRAVFKAGGEERVVEAGFAYRFAPGEEHSVEAVRESLFLDVFAPPRQDYLRRQSEAEARAQQEPGEERSSARAEQKFIGSLKS